MTFELGQTVILLHGIDLSRNKHNPQEAVITRVGRVNVAIEQYGREYVFDKVTGFEKRGANAIGAASRIYTPEILAAEQERDAIEADLKPLGFDGSYGRITGYSTDALRQVRDILAADREKGTSK